MGRALLVVFIVTVLGYTLMAIFATNLRGLAIESSAQSTVVPEGVNTTSEDFNETGTLVFYPNNVGPIPYLFYQARDGHTAARALTFPSRPPTDFSSWTGARVSVTGILDQEHVVVTRIAYISAP